MRAGATESLHSSTRSLSTVLYCTTQHRTDSSRNGCVWWSALSHFVSDPFSTKMMCKRWLFPADCITSLTSRRLRLGHSDTRPLRIFLDFGNGSLLIRCTKLKWCGTVYQIRHCVTASASSRSSIKDIAYAVQDSFQAECMPQKVGSSIIL